MQKPRPTCGAADTIDVTDLVRDGWHLSPGFVTVIVINQGRQHDETLTMAKSELTVRHLLRSGFKSVGCWELSNARKLMCAVDFPTLGGVYAFAVDGVVQYVGLASTSLRQRLSHYQNPGASQSTNIRLNDIIRGRIDQGSVVEILLAYPPNFAWRGLRISGAQGLEHGLIAEFFLPWNVTGSAKGPEFVVRPDTRKPSATERILNIVSQRPGLTELEIARAMYGQSAIQQNVNQDCRLLVQLKLVERVGVGGRGDPYVYRIRSE